MLAYNNTFKQCRIKDKSFTFYINTLIYTVLTNAMKSTATEVTLGAATTLKCATSAATVFWSRERGNMPANVAFSSGNGHSLTIYDVKIKDLGVYICQYQKKEFGSYVYLSSSTTVSLNGRWKGQVVVADFNLK